MRSSRSRFIVGGAVVTLAVVFGWLLFVTLPKRYDNVASKAVSAAPAAAPAPTGRKIKARLFYVAEDGQHLTSVERDVAYGDGAVAQAREIVAAQLAPVTDPLVSAIPPGTNVRAVYLTERGDVYVDLSREATTAHPGGTTSEMLTVYSIVDALTVNLPAVRAVQILVDGKEQDTLAGHVDLRRPLEKNLEFVQ
jgi:spore germination protein GerM